MKRPGHKVNLVWLLFAIVSLLLLPYLLYKSQSVDYGQYNRFIGAVSQLRELDTQLNESLLVVNQRPAMSYDRIARGSNELHQANEKLWQVMPREFSTGLDGQKVLFEQTLLEKLALIEDYKSHHAVLKNSSTYFALTASKVIADRSAPEEVARTINEILHAIHRFRIDHSNIHLERVKLLRETLQQELARLGLKGQDPYDVMNIHTGIILRYALEISDLLDEILQFELPRQLSLMQQDVTGYHDQLEREADHYRHALFAVSLLLALAVAITLVRQRRSVCELDKALNELEFQKHALDEHAIVSIADVKGDILYANQKFCDISGYSLEELKGQNHRLVKSAEHPPEFFREMWRTIASGNVWQGEIHNVSRYGDDYWVRSSIVPFLNEKGKPFRYVSIRTDITERKLLQQKIEGSHRFLTSITENIGECVYVLDGNGDCTFLNKEAERQLGWSKEELLGKNIHNIIHFQYEDGSPMPQCECPAHLSISQGLKFRSEDEFLTRKDGSLFPVSMISVPMDANDMQMGSVTVFQDISARRVSEREMIAAREQAEHASRMKSEFLANMSHEIRTPMNGMLGTIELLRDTPLNETQYEYVEAAHRSSEHLLTLINDILDLSKFEAGNIELESVDFDLTEALEDLADLYAANAQGKGLELIWGIASDVPEWVKGDRVRLWQVLTNLTGNAIKFTEQGAVSIKTSLQQTDGDALQLRFDIIDTGIGIPKEAQGRIFNAFEQADGSMTRRFGGTGLGLSLSKRLIGLMGGEIGVESQPGAGSTFWFTVNLERSAVTEQPRHDAVLQGKRVLIVDDVALNRMILERFIRQWQMSPTTACSSEEAQRELEQAAARGESYDLLLIDHNMPGMDGLTLAAHVRQQPRFALCKLVLHSSEAEKLSKQAEKVSNLDAVLRKPLRRRTLQHQLLRLYGAAKGNEANAHQAASNEWLHAKILLVDDNDVNRMIARGMLEKLGVNDIDTAENGRQALEQVKSSHYDLVLMDIQMPLMNGHEATRAIRQHEADSEHHTTIVALTAHAFAEDIERCIEAGMDDYLSKPLQRDALQSVMSRWMEQNPDSVNDEPLPTPVNLVVSDSSHTAESVLDESVITMLREIMGDEGMKMAVDSYISDAPRQIASMRAGFSNRDWELLTRAAHTLKGSSGSMGARQLVEATQQLELQGKARQEAGIEALTDEVERQFARVHVALERFAAG